MDQQGRDLRRGVLVLAAIGLAGCASQQGAPASIPAPGDVKAAAEPPAEAAATVDDELPPNVEPAPEDELPPGATEQGEVEVSDEEIDRELRELLGPDPVGIARSPGAPDEPSIPLEMNERVEAWIHYFQNVIPDRFALYLQRSGRYEPMIRDKLREAGVPQELFYL
ncbi:MAG: hypothetical protein ACRELC_02515, partial [Gemmatimonadota bacterium]